MSRKKDPIESVVAYFSDAPYPSAANALTLVQVLMKRRRAAEGPAEVKKPAKRKKVFAVPTQDERALPLVSKVGD